MKRQSTNLSLLLAAAAIIALLDGRNAIAQTSTAYGTGALQSNTGPDNSAFGYNALQNNTQAGMNTATGAYALQYNGSRGGLGLIPTGNTATGAYALRNNDADLFGDAGSFNTGTGVSALYSNVYGECNTGTGANALYNNVSGSNNTATGCNALLDTLNGQRNTATGVDAMQKNTAGSDNTATGEIALAGNTTGNNNTATGRAALSSNTTGNYNTATGTQAMGLNSVGHDNTADGYLALQNNLVSNNTAVGSNALRNTQGGDRNTAIGMDALYSNITGITNTAVGQNALYANTTGHHNTATGVQALQQNTTGIFNTADGLNALNGNTSGQYNIGVGFDAGLNLTTGNHNIDIASLGAAGDSNTIRIGTQETQTTTFIAGISATGVTGAPVVVSSVGKLGVVLSSARYKQNIQNMGDGSDGLMKLRPVTFRYKSDEQGITRYGLVAEEVEKVYPELVTYGADGKVETVQYLTLISMLLNEMQKQTQENRRQAARLAGQAEQVRQLTTELAALNSTFARRLAALEQHAAGAERNRKLTAMDQ